MAYDNDEVMPSRTGTLFVDGTLSCTSLNVNGVTPATQSYVTGLGYITATPGANLNMNTYTIAFSNSGAGLKWGNNYSQIYDDSNLHINTDDVMYISAPTQLNITSPNTYFTGNVYTNNNLLASQSWVQSQNYLTTSQQTLQ